MAKNKKNLAEQKPSDAESYMMVDMGGKQRRVDRLDMSDEEWNTTKQTAIDKGIFKFAHDREAVQTKTEPMQGESQDLLAEKKASTPAADLPKREPSESFQPEKPSKPMEEKLKEPIQIKVGDSTYTVPADEASKLDLKKLTEQNKAAGEGTGTLGGKLRSVAAKLFEGATPSDQAQKDRELVDSIQLPKTTPAKPGSAASIRAAASKDMAASAATEPLRAGLSQEMAAEAAAAPPEVSQQVVNGPQVTPRPESMAGAVVPPQEPGLLSKMNIFDPNSQINQSIGEAIGTRPSQTPPPAGGPMLVDPPPPSANKMAPTAGANVPVVPPAPTGSSTSKVSVASKTGPTDDMPPLVDRRAELSAASDAHNAAAMANAEAEAQGLRDQADVMRKGLREATDMELERRLADKVAQDHVREAQAAYTKTVEAMKAPEKIDPDRWWNNRPTAQKIFAVLSAGLTRGATLGMFQDAISRDIQAQQHDISNARIANQQKAEGQHNVYQMARQNGLDERAAYLTAEANAWDNVERSSKLAAMSAKAPSVIAAAQEQAALANQQKIEKLAALDGHLETQAIERKKLFLENRKLDILEMKKAGSGKPKAGKQLPAHQTEALGDLEASLAQTKKLAAEFGHPNLFQSLWDKARGAVDATGPQARFNKRVKALIQNIGPGMGSGVLNASDLKRWDELAAKAGTVAGDESWKALVDEIEAKLNSRKKSFARAGFNMTGYDTGTPEESSGMSDEDAYGILTGEAF